MNDYIISHKSIFVKEKVDGALRLFVAQSIDLRLKVSAPPSATPPCGLRDLAKHLLRQCKRGAHSGAPNALAEEVGFEPTRRVNGLRDFESRLFDHLSTPPNIQLSEF